MSLESFDTLIYGEDGQSPIRPTIIRMLDIVKKENIRLRIDVRSQAQGTTNSRNEHTLYADPSDNADADGLMRILVERLNDSPGEGYVGLIRINFSQAGSSGERYGSWQRTIKSPSLGRSRLSQPDEDEGDDGSSEDDNSSESFHTSSRHRGGHNRMENEYGGGSSMPMGVLLEGDTIRVWMDSMMNHNFRMLAQQQAMFDRSLRMMESYTMRFGFPTHEQGIVEARGGEPPPSAAPGSPGPNNYGLLPMLLQGALKMATGQGAAPAPAPAPAPEPAITQRPARDNSRALAIRGSSQMVQSLRPIPRPRPPAPGYEPAPPVDEERQRPSARWQEDDQEMGADEETGAEEYAEDEGENEGAEDEDEYGQEEDQPVARRERAPMTHASGGGSEMPDLNGLTPDQMKAVVIAWIRSDPSRKSDVANMLGDLAPEIM